VICVAAGCGDPSVHLELFCQKHKELIPTEVFVALESRYNPDEKPSPSTQALVRRAILVILAKEKGLNVDRRP
jgi:hypothetical protein